MLILIFILIFSISKLFQFFLWIPPLTSFNLNLKKRNSPDPCELLERGSTSTLLFEEPRTIGWYCWGNKRRLADLRRYEGRLSGWLSMDVRTGGASALLPSLLVNAVVELWRFRMVSECEWFMNAKFIAMIDKHFTNF